MNFANFFGIVFMRIPLIANSSILLSPNFFAYHHVYHVWSNPIIEKAAFLIEFHHLFTFNLKFPLN